MNELITDLKTIELETLNNLKFSKANNTIRAYRSDFKDFALSKIKPGGKITYWNNAENEYNPYLFDSISYEQISITPEANKYTHMENNYYMPKVVI